MKSYAILSLIAIACFLLNACAPSPKKAIIGKWQTEETGVRVEYLSDGALLVTDGTMTFGGKYTILDDGRLKLEFTLLGTPTVRIMQVSVTGDLMNTIDDNGKKEELKRIK